MKISGFKCPYCGAEITVRANRKYVKCEYCNSSLYVDRDAVRPAGDDDLETAVPAAKEARTVPDKQPSHPEQKKTDGEKKREATPKERKAQTAPRLQTKPVSPPTSAPSSGEKKHISPGAIILWIVFFPFMLSGWLLRRKKVPLLLRWLAVLLFWVILIFLGREYYNRNKREVDIYRLTFPAFSHYFKEDAAETEKTEGEAVTAATGETQPVTESGTATSETEKRTEKKEEGRRAAYLKGRGNTETDGKVPDYVGVIGYAVTGYTEKLTLEMKDSCFDTPWQVPVYEKDKQFLNWTGTVDHKTEVLVLSQDLKHEGHGRYSGYLLVREIATGREFFLNVENFITKPYWEYDDLVEAVKVGDFLAEYHPKSDYYPVTKDNGKVELEEGFKVLVRGLTSTFGRGGPDRDLTQLACVVFKDWKYGYGGVNVFFNKDDLTIIY